jgi:hypothetical protein
VIRVGMPLAIVEGEFEALLLNQELAGLASAITLGGAGDWPTPSVLGAMLKASPWYAAGDADEAGEKAAEGWLARSGRSRRVRPPGASKDWTAAKQGGVGLRRYWSEVLAGNDPPPLHTWEELAALRWGPGVRDLEPGLVVPHDGRSLVATQPHTEWARRRARSGELQEALGRAPTAEEIREADRRAAAAPGIAGSDPEDTI